MSGQWRTYTMSKMVMMRLVHPVCHMCLIKIAVGDKVASKHKCRKSHFRIYHKACYDQLFYGCD